MSKREGAEKGSLDKPSGKGGIYRKFRPLLFFRKKRDHSTRDSPGAAATPFTAAVRASALTDTATQADESQGFRAATTDSCDGAVSTDDSRSAASAPMPVKTQKASASTCAARGAKQPVASAARAGHDDNPVLPEVGLASHSSRPTISDAEVLSATESVNSRRRSSDSLPVHNRKRHDGSTADTAGAGNSPAKPDAPVPADTANPFGGITGTSLPPVQRAVQEHRTTPRESPKDATEVREKSGSHRSSRSSRRNHSCRRDSTRHSDRGKAESVVLKRYIIAAGASTPPEQTTNTALGTVNDGCGTTREAVHDATVLHDELFTLCRGEILSRLSLLQQAEIAYKDLQLSCRFSHAYACAVDLLHSGTNAHAAAGQLDGDLQRLIADALEGTWSWDAAWVEHVYASCLLSPLSPHNDTPLIAGPEQSARECATACTAPAAHARTVSASPISGAQGTAVHVGSFNEQLCTRLHLFLLEQIAVVRRLAVDDDRYAITDEDVLPDASVQPSPDSTSASASRRSVTGTVDCSQPAHAVEGMQQVFLRRLRLLGSVARLFLLQCAAVKSTPLVASGGECKELSCDTSLEGIVMTEARARRVLEETLLFHSWSELQQAPWHCPASTKLLLSENCAQRIWHCDVDKLAGEGSDDSRRKKSISTVGQLGTLGNRSTRATAQATLSPVESFFSLLPDVMAPSQKSSSTYTPSGPFSLHSLAHSTATQQPQASTSSMPVASLSTMDTKASLDVIKRALHRRPKGHRSGHRQSRCYGDSQSSLCQSLRGAARNANASISQESFLFPGVLTEVAKSSSAAQGVDASAAGDQSSPRRRSHLQGARGFAALSSAHTTSLGLDSSVDHSTTSPSYFRMLAGRSSDPYSPDRTPALMAKSLHSHPSSASERSLATFETGFDASLKYRSILGDSRASALPGLGNSTVRPYRGQYDSGYSSQTLNTTHSGELAPFGTGFAGSGAALQGSSAPTTTCNSPESGMQARRSSSPGGAEFGSALYCTPFTGSKLSPEMYTLSSFHPDAMSPLSLDRQTQSAQRSPQGRGNAREDIISVHLPEERSHTIVGNALCDGDALHRRTLSAVSLGNRCSLTEAAAGLNNQSSFFVSQEKNWIAGVLSRCVYEAKRQRLATATDMCRETTNPLTLRDHPRSVIGREQTARLLVRVESIYRGLLVISEEREMERLARFHDFQLVLWMQQEEMKQVMHAMQGVTFVLQAAAIRNTWAQLQEEKSVLLRRENDQRARLFLLHLALQSKVNVQRECEDCLALMREDYAVLLGKQTYIASQRTTSSCALQGPGSAAGALGSPLSPGSPGDETQVLSSHTVPACLQTLAGKLDRCAAAPDGCSETPTGSTHAYRRESTASVSSVTADGPIVIQLSGRRFRPSAPSTIATSLSHSRLNLSDHSLASVSSRQDATPGSKRLSNHTLEHVQHNLTSPPAPLESSPATLAVQSQGQPHVSTGTASKHEAIGKRT